MPYKEHLIFEEPTEENLWRYMDFQKFVSILQTGSLYFPTAKLLKKVDPWEGTFMKRELEYRLKEDYKIEEYFRYLNKNNEKIGYDYMKKRVENYKTISEQQQNINFVSCWHYNSCESAAMWRLYLKSNEGLAIKTKTSRFKESFNNTMEEIYIGKVKYLDYEHDTFYDKSDVERIGNTPYILYLPFIRKRKIFEHEKEYRAIYCDDSNYDGKKSGVFIRVDLDKLIESIVVSPYCNIWFKEILENTIKDYQYNFKIEDSEIIDEPYNFDLSPFVDL